MDDGAVLSAGRRGGDSDLKTKGGTTVLWTLLVILVVLWLLGLATNVVGGLIHILLVLALIVFLFQLLSGRRAV